MRYKTATRVRFNMDPAIYSKGRIEATKYYVYKDESGDFIYGAAPAGKVYSVLSEVDDAFALAQELNKKKNER